jgi:excisionase family DNA binding protein
LNKENGMKNMATNTDKIYCTPAEVAELIGTETATIQRYCRDGKIEAIKEGRSWFIARSEFDRFVKDYQAGRVARKGFANPDHPYYGKGREPDPNSRLQRGEQTHIFLPATDEHGAWLRDILAPDERLAILSRFAEMKNRGRDISKILEGLDQ